MSGEEFLNKLYKELNLSAEVQHTAMGTKDKNEAVARYMERLTKTHDQALKNEHRIELLKQMYYDKYVVKEIDIPKYRDKERIIQGQKNSLDRWLDYLLDESTVYPMWAKYWAFQGMLKIGTYDEANGVYQKRSKKTLAPFIDANPEVIARCINLAIDYIGKKELNDNELAQLVDSGNFSKLYTVLLKKQKENTIAISESNDGIWITYHYETEKETKKKEIKGIEPEYLKLYNSLQGYNTGWCTAGGKDTAKNQICGISGYIGGDFHVYYTNDDNNEYKVPRIAIRMDKENIGEIRGIAEGQNIEDGLEEIVKEKISTFKGITGSNIAKYLEIINNMKYLTLLNKKNASNQEFTEADVKFIYELNKTIEGFGWEKDPRIEKIICKRNKEKDASVLTEHKDIITFWSRYFAEAPTEIKANKEISLDAVKREIKALNFVSEELKHDKEFILEILKFNFSNHSRIHDYLRKRVHSLEFVSEEIKNDRELALEVDDNKIRVSSKLMKKFCNDGDFVLEVMPMNASVLSFVSEELKNDREFSLKVFKKARNQYLSSLPNLYSISEELKHDKEFILAAVKENTYALEYASEKLKHDREFILAAVKQNGFIYRDVPEELKNDREIVLEALKHHFSGAFKYASEKLKNDKETVLEVVKQSGGDLEYASEELKNDREIVLAAVKETGYAFKYASEKLKNDREFVLAAVKQNDRAFEYASEELQKDREIVLEALKTSFSNGKSLGFISKRYQGRKEILLEAEHTKINVSTTLMRRFSNDKVFILEIIPKNAKALEYASEELKNNREFVLTAVKRNGCALQYVSETLKNDREIVLEALKQNRRALKYVSNDLLNMHQNYFATELNTNKKGNKK